jgi:hypothetical protein
MTASPDGRISVEHPLPLEPSYVDGVSLLPARAYLLGCHAPPPAREDVRERLLDADR